jgi:mono/diheme cytochrome c family protein
MLLIRSSLGILLVALTAYAAAIEAGDARRGEQLFHTEQCIQCHRVNGEGGVIATDLARRVDRDFTPTVMASLMWNHAPEMWDAMKKQGIVKGTLPPESAADLFAFFISKRYFEKTGDAARGKQLFSSKHCAVCHGLTTSNAAGAPPVSEWDSLGDPIILVQQMWNHGTQMQKALAENKIARPELSAQELTDMLVYLQHLPQTRNLATNFSFTDSESGEALFQSKGCAGCHTGSLALETRLKNQTLTAIAADMWNHQPRMKNPPPVLSQEEMRRLVAYLWGRQYFRGSGNAERGKKVFADKSCYICHGNRMSGAPSLAKGKDSYSDISMVSALWQHGPRMAELMKERKLAWPRFTAAEMSDLIAYLNSLGTP